MSNSTHRVEVFEVAEVRPHPNADRLDVLVYEGYQTVVARDSFHRGQLAAFVPPDTLVPVARPEFAFLAPKARADGRARIKAVKLRGEPSFGLVVPAPAGSKPGDDVAGLMGAIHYDPLPELGPRGPSGMVFGGEVAPAPNVPFVKYDVESGRRYAKRLFVDGELVHITEKLHGASARYVFHDGQMHCGSRGEWKREFPTYDHVTLESLEPKVGRERAEEILDKLHTQKAKRNLWWEVLRNTPALEVFCRKHPETVVYGEVFGGVQDLRYGHVPGTASFAAFDIMLNGKWLDATYVLDLCLDNDIPCVPVLTTNVPYDFDSICALAEGPSTWPGANHVREGVVVKPMTERSDPRLGRACLKWVGVGYLSRK